MSCISMCLGVMIFMYKKLCDVIYSSLRVCYMCVYLERKLLGSGVRVQHVSSWPGT